MKRINLNEILLISALLGLGINIPIAQGDSNNKGFVEKQFATFNDVEVNSDNIVKNFDKESLVDRGDFYYLNTGKRAYFLREKNVFIIIHHDRRVVPLMSPEEIQGRFGDRLDIIKDHPLHKFVKFRVKQGEDPQDIISSLLLADPTISFISPSLRSSDRGGELAVSPHIIVSIDDSINPDYAIAELQSYNLSLISGLAFSDNEYEMHIDEPITDTGRIFELTRSVAELPYVTWAEPNFIVSTEKQFIPDDPLFDDQWHLHNTGQNGAAVDADIDAPEGWDISQGVDAVIAIYDGGIDLSHEDLNIWSNQGETGGGKETNGIDDDGNGYIDDYQGWDFTDNDNDPSPVDEPGPFGFKDNHGTAVAGVAGAIGNNNKGVSGSAPGAVILPVRMNSGYCSTFADAMRYAGKHADVVNNSWSIDACESNLNSAISDVVNGTITGARRGTKGTPVLFASGWIKFTLTGFPVGTYTFRWKYSKDSTTSSGYDTVWVDDIGWPGGMLQILKMKP